MGGHCPYQLYFYEIDALLKHEKESIKLYLKNKRTLQTKSIVIEIVPLGKNSIRS